MMTAEQLLKSEIEQRVWRARQIVEYIKAHRIDEGTEIFVADQLQAHAAAQLAEKERELTESYEFREVEIQLRMAAEQRLQEAQADLKADDLDMSLIACEIGSCDATREDIVKRIRALRQREAELEQARKHLYIHHICTHDEYVGALRPRVPSPPKEAKVAGEDAGRE